MLQHVWMVATAVRQVEHLAEGLRVCVRVQVHAVALDSAMRLQRGT